MSASFPHPFKEMKRKYLAMVTKLPLLASNEAVNEFKNNFRIEGFRGDAGVEFWKKRKIAKSKVNDSTRAILVKSGRLKRGIRAAPLPGTARVLNDVPYSEVHNAGLTINHPGGERINHFKTYKSGKHKGKTLFAKAKQAQFAQKNHAAGYTIKMPQRKFMGTSRPLINNISKIVDRELKQILP